MTCLHMTIGYKRLDITIGYDGGGACFTSIFEIEGGEGKVVACAKGGNAQIYPRAFLRTLPTMPSTRTVPVTFGAAFKDCSKMEHA